LLCAVAVVLAALLYGGTSVIFLANRHFCAVDTILAVEDVGAIHVHIGRVYVFNHVTAKFLEVVGHRQRVA